MTKDSIILGPPKMPSDKEIQEAWDEHLRLMEENNKPIDLTVKGEEAKERIEIAIPEGYEYVIESDKIIFTKKKNEYPKTYEECCDTLSVYSSEHASLVAAQLDLPMNTFIRLLVARNAYWKIAGEEMGLGKPWKPDWTESSTKYIIDCFGDNIAKGFTAKQNTRLAFPTEEMRDAFKENFDPDIEICKEFL